MQTDVFHDLTESGYLDWIQMMLQSLFMWHVASESLRMRTQCVNFQFGTICCYIKSILFFNFYLFIYWPYLTACRILILLLGVGPGPQKWKHQILTIKPPRNFLHTIFFFFKEERLFPKSTYLVNFLIWLSQVLAAALRICNCGARVSSLAVALALWLWGVGLVVPRHVRSYLLTRDWTWASCMGSVHLSPWMTRDIPTPSCLKSPSSVCGTELSWVSTYPSVPLFLISFQLFFPCPFLK